MNHIERLTPLSDLENIATDLSTLLSDPRNEDISIDFPGSVSRYTGNIEDVVKNLGKAADDCRPGYRQQFVAYSDKQAVGLAVVRCVDIVPEGIDQIWPNVSLLICHPHRGQGLGKLSLKACLMAVEQQFNNSAWTEVRKSNIASTKLVLSAGFLPTSETDEKIAYSYHR